MRIEITWAIDDGYAGANTRPHKTFIDIDEDEWDEMTDEERQDEVNDAVEEAFNQNINWYVVSQKIKQ